MNIKNNVEQVFAVALTKEQIAIIKAGLQYYWLADEYGYSLWGVMPGACVGRSDRNYRNKVALIYEELNKLTKVKTEYGYWGDIKRISKLCHEDYKKAKKEGEEAEQKMHEEYLHDEAIREEINKNGLNGDEILNNANKVFKAKMEDYQRKKEPKKVEEDKFEDEEIMASDL